MKNYAVLIEVELENDFGTGLKAAQEEVQKSIEHHNSIGMKVVAITPLTTSRCNDVENEYYGYSFTSGILIVFEEE